MTTNNSTNNYYAQNNIIIGGNFDTNPWQRGTSFTNITNSYTADRFSWVANGTGIFSVAQTSDSPNFSQSNIFSQNSMRGTVTTADATMAAGSYYYISYTIEGYDFIRIAQNNFVIVFWVKSSTAGSYAVSLRNTATTFSYIAPYTISNANTWQKVVLFITASPSSGTWNYTNGAGLIITFSMGCGTTYKTSTTNSWVSGNFLSSTSQVNNMSTINNIFALDLIKVIPGLTDTPLFTRLAADELALCQRYYYKTFNQGIAPAQNSGSLLSPLSYKIPAGLGSTLGQFLSFPVQMRTTPTLIAYNPQNTNTNWRDITAGADSGASGFINAGSGGVLVSNPQGLLEAVGNTVCIHVTASADF